MKLNLKLEDMNYTESTFVGPYGNTIIHNKYEHTFSSGHRLVVYTLADGKLWMCDFFTPARKSGSTGTRNTAQEAFNIFKDVFENDSVRPELIKGFQE